MFGLGLWEFVLIVVIALIVLGPRRLPELGRQLGRALRELRRASDELRRSLHADEIRDEIRSELQPEKKGDSPPAPEHKEISSRNDEPPAPSEPKDS